MKTEHLHDLWSSPDNSRLTSKQLSFRMPVHIAAKIAALCEMYPTKNRTQIVADLLASAIDSLEKTLPERLGNPISREDEKLERMIAEHEHIDYVPMFYLGGERGRFRHLANQQYKEMEKELGNESPALLYESIYMTEEDCKKK
ncbi:MAG: hypothetical protein HY847_13660 [Betaproteobacteria bacterium]|nr:hypothetical protein [Betaproteobacteria bacterium]